MLSELRTTMAEPTNTDAVTVLVVEDEALVRLLLQDELTSAGFFAHLAGSADEAIELLERGTRVDFVLSDVMMPGSMNGIGLADWVRRNRPDLPLALTSGVTHQKLLDLGMRKDQPYFGKPVRFDELFAHIASVCGPALAAANARS